jgi:pyruvate/2-oxoglutarate dehydrogenase complex dihydrolipoamide acyltransferase (E2) component
MPQPPRPATGPPRATPLGRRLARAHGLDLAAIAGSGPGGRVTRRDVERRLAAPAADGPATAPGAAGHRPAPPRPVGNAPAAWLLVEADLTALLAGIARQRDAFRRREGGDLTPLAAILQALAAALRQHPLLNAAWAGTAIRRRRSITLAVVGATAAPVLIPRAEDRTLADLARALAGPATAGAAAEAASFTVFAAAPAWHIVQPALPDGQAACLVVGAPVRRLAAVDDAIAVRALATLGVVFDHRVLDGAPVGAFLRTLRERLETGWTDDRRPVGGAG